MPSFPSPHLCADARLTLYRALYYLAYLAEEETPGATYTVAPGCTGSRTNSRCTLAEFLLYIWKEHAPNDTTKPTGWKPGKVPKETNGDFTQNKIDSMISTINSARTNEGHEITGNSDGKLLLPGVDGDYYQTLAKIGEPINKMVSAMGDSPSKKQLRIQARSKSAGEAVVGLRWMDMETYRLGYLRKELKRTLGDAADVVTKTWRSGYQGDAVQLDADGNEIPNTHGKQFQMLDIPETMNANGNRASEVLDAVRTYAFHNQETINHFTAIASGQEAALNIGCTLP